MPPHNPFDRFTPDARQALQIAESEAKKANLNFIGTEHLLLAILSLPKSLGCSVLLGIGVSYENVLNVIKATGKNGGQGDSTLANSNISTYLAKVIEDATICFIPSSTMISFMKNNSDFSLELMQIACSELGVANSFITGIAQKTVRERLAEILIYLKREFGTDEDNILQISLTREEFANIVGTATESVIRLLSEFKDDKYIELNGRKIKILEEAKLKRLGNVFD